MMGPDSTIPPSAEDTDKFPMYFEPEHEPFCIVRPVMPLVYDLTDEALDDD
jgi:hypothetical protein